MTHFWSKMTPFLTHFWPLPDKTGQKWPILGKNPQKTVFKTLIARDFQTKSRFFSIFGHFCQFWKKPDFQWKTPIFRFFEGPETKSSENRPSLILGPLKKWVQKTLKKCLFWPFLDPFFSGFESSWNFRLPGQVFFGFFKKCPQKPFLQKNAKKRVFRTLKMTLFWPIFGHFWKTHFFRVIFGSQKSGGNHYGFFPIFEKNGKKWSKNGPKMGQKRGSFLDQPRYPYPWKVKKTQKTRFFCCRNIRGRFFPIFRFLQINEVNFQNSTFSTLGPKSIQLLRGKNCKNGPK